MSQHHFGNEKKVIPEGTQLLVTVSGGFHGVKNLMHVMHLNLVVATPGDFFGIEHTYQSKIYDIRADKRDLANTHLDVFNSSIENPIVTEKGHYPTTEQINSEWAGKAQAMVTFGVFEHLGSKFNFISSIVEA